MNDQEKAQDTSRRMQDATRLGTRDATRMVDQFAAAGAETIAVWSSVTQGLVDDMLDLGSRNLRETTRVMADLQDVGVTAFRDWQSAAVRWQMSWPEALRDPFHWYQRAVEESVEAARQSFELSRRGAETVVHGMERLQASADETNRALSERFRSAASRIQEVTREAEQRRAA